MQLIENYACNDIKHCKQNKNVAAFYKIIEKFEKCFNADLRNHIDCVTVLLKKTKKVWKTEKAKTIFK